ncbi:PREDICTED: ATPase family AAA domain-containing protein 5 [Dinoponera quadriceps]|uniref:ATPase family AAA domain-containing protein 5 n=1 Tax=Dinoponera quadriceps TaxID=609295 RepID=A0A6P3X2D8_DINQU|nr:PREDICTED: ATPase family AAA domain-containing protein 5 [Dinoponera quadriceps]
MRDIKQYFRNGAKTYKKAVDSAERTVEEEEDVADAAKGSNRKRKRVKIRISRTGSNGRTCDIVESKNDLIDKTPSPFAKLGAAMSGNKSRNVRNISQGENGETHGNKLDEQIVVDLIDSSDDTPIKSVHDGGLANARFCDDDSQREESNAFQVLMSRGKPIQYKTPPQQSVEAECHEKSSEAKELRSKRKEKLIALADKKGYLKRKLTDAEEGERIERNIENRMKIFKSNNNGKDDGAELSIKNNKQLSGGLLNYFSKSPVELRNKECVSTIIVKADVHRTETADFEPVPVLKPISNKIYPVKRCSKVDLNLSKLDDIHVIESENLTSPPTLVTDKQEKRQKPRWSLRIKLHSSEDNDGQDDTTDDELFSPRSRSKFVPVAKSQTLLNTYVENDRSRSKNHNGHIKVKARDKEENESLGKRKASVPANVVEGPDTPLVIRSEEAGKVEKTFNGAHETVMTDDSECEIINECVSGKKPNGKLAPLFTKRRRTDPAVVAAKRLFLQSDLSDLESKATDRKPSNVTLTLPFPVISHVAQLESGSSSSRSEIEHKFPMKAEKKYLPSVNIDEYRCITNYNEAVSGATVSVDKPVKGSFEEVLSEMEERCPDVPEMWKTVSTIRNKTEKKRARGGGRRTKSLERKGLTGSVEATTRSHDCVWTCKYKPMSAQEVVGNEEAATKLKDWLSGWRITTKEGYSSGEEFYSSDCSSNPYNHENNQTAVLLGPHGSGKSASVYAVAEELGYSVLEVNASSRRTGKRILKELEEATKSHRIKKNKHGSSFERAAEENEAPEISQNSLILLEDIDLIFEEDEGFVSAAYQLASNTKRPIVMTCRDICPHLSRMASQQNKIYFRQVNGSRASALLELIALAETGHRLSHDCLMKLLQTGDLRKALLQLQYLLLSGPPVLSEQSATARSSLWQDMQRYLYKPAIKLSKKHKAKKDRSGDKPNEQMGDDPARILSGLASDLDGLSLVSSLIDVDDVVLNPPKASVQPNLSLAENLSLYSASRRSIADIASFMSERLLQKKPLSGNESAPSNPNNVVLRNQLNRGVDLALSYVTPACLDRRVMATDYLPTARAICRAEQSRCVGSHKRGNRFFHYLHGLNVPTASMKPNILAAACRTLQEKLGEFTSDTTNVNVD